MQNGGPLGFDVASDQQMPHFIIIKRAESHISWDPPSGRTWACNPLLKKTLAVILLILARLEVVKMVLLASGDFQGC